MVLLCPGCCAEAKPQDVFCVACGFRMREVDEPEVVLPSPKVVVADPVSKRNSTSSAGSPKPAAGRPPPARRQSAAAKSAGEKKNGASNDVKPSRKPPAISRRGPPPSRRGSSNGSSSPTQKVQLQAPAKDFTKKDGNKKTDKTAEEPAWAKKTLRKSTPVGGMPSPNSSPAAASTTGTEKPAWAVKTLRATANKPEENDNPPPSPSAAELITSSAPAVNASPAAPQRSAKKPPARAASGGRSTPTPNARLSVKTALPQPASRSSATSTAMAAVASREAPAESVPIKEATVKSAAGASNETPEWAAKKLKSTKVIAPSPPPSSLPRGDDEVNSEEDKPAWARKILKPTSVLVAQPESAPHQKTPHRAVAAVPSPAAANDDDDLASETPAWAKKALKPTGVLASPSSDPTAQHSSETTAEPYFDLKPADVVAGSPLANDRSALSVEEKRPLISLPARGTKASSSGSFVPTRITPVVSTVPVRAFSVGSTVSADNDQEPEWVTPKLRQVACSSSPNIPPPTAQRKANTVQAAYSTLPSIGDTASPPSAARNVVRSAYDKLPTSDSSPLEHPRPTQSPSQPDSSQKLSLPLPSRPAPSGGSSGANSSPGSSFVAPGAMSAVDRWYRAEKDRLMREKARAAAEDDFIAAQEFKVKLEELEVEYEDKKRSDSTGTDSVDTSPALISHEVVPPRSAALPQDTSTSLTTDANRTGATVPLVVSVCAVAPAGKPAWGTFASKKGNMYVGTLDLVLPVYVFGSAPDCDVRLNDPRISPRHFQLTAEDNTTDGITEVFISNISSQSNLLFNKTVVGSERIRINHSDEISLTVERGGVHDDIFVFEPADRRRLWKSRQDVVQTLRGTDVSRQPPENLSSDTTINQYKRDAVAKFEAGTGGTSAAPRVMPRVPTPREHILATIDNPDEEKNARENERLKNEIAVLEQQLEVRRQKTAQVLSEIRRTEEEVAQLMSENKALKLRIRA